MKVGQSIEIYAPPEKVWPFLIEPDKVLQWCITFKKFEYKGDQKSGQGTPLYIEEQAGGKLTKMDFVVSEWQENAKLTIQMVSGASYKSYIQHFLLEPLPSGCQFTFMEEIIFPYGVIGRLIGFAAQSMSAATVNKMLVKLKTLAEV